MTFNQERAKIIGARNYKSAKTWQLLHDKVQQEEEQDPTTSAAL